MNSTTHLSHIRYFGTALILLFIPLLASASIQFKADEIYCDSIEGLKAKSLGIYIEEVATGKVLLDVNGEVPMIPASITKVVTAASYFSSLDINRRYNTDIFLAGMVVDSTLQGDILIVSDGDPTLESRHFKAQSGLPSDIAKALQKTGIKKVTGTVRVEEPKWLDEPQPAGWESGDFTWSYGAGYMPINYADNTMTVTLSRADDPVCSPRSPGSSFQRTNGKGSSIARRRDSAHYTFSHNGRKLHSTTVANGSPESTLIYEVTRSIEEAGIEICGESLSDSPTQRTLLLSHLSAPLGEIIESLLLRSDNMMAEAVLRQIAPNQSRSNALKVQKDLWQTRGVDYRDIVIEDGSGLSRTNRITPYFMADILVWMLENQENFMKFCNYLPLAGHTGTLRSFLKDTPLDGRLRAKTGSMSGVQCYAGYAIDALGVPTHIVVIMANDFQGSRAALKKYLESLLIEKIQ